MTKEQQTVKENRICELLHSLDDCVTYPVFCFMVEELIILLQQVKDKRKECYNILSA